MSQAGSVIVALAVDEDLSFVFQAPEGLRVDDAVAVALETEPEVVFGLRVRATTTVGRRHSDGREFLALSLFEIRSSPHPAYGASVVDVVLVLLVLVVVGIVVVVVVGKSGGAKKTSEYAEPSATVSPRTKQPRPSARQPTTCSFTVSETTICATV
jgi:hypothetical protein